jgi:hypothetical protein
MIEVVEEPAWGFISDALAPVSRDDARNRGPQRDSRAATK